MSLRFTVILLLAVVAPAGGAQVIDSTVAIPMRDGVSLRATVLRPSERGRFPTLVYRTPYGASAAVRGDSIFTRAVARGYAVVVQDVRGRYRSDGRFDPYRQEGKDGYDTIEWAAAQPWSSGDVGTFGLSYPGAVQWLAAVESPPHLKAMVPAMTFSRPDNFWYAGGLLDLSWLSWIWFNIAPDERRRYDLAGPRTGREARASWDSLGPLLLARRPTTNVSEIAGVAPWYLEWLAHPPTDAWWQWADLRGRYAKTSAAVLNISGWHDEAYGPEGAVTNFLGLLAARAAERDPRTFLVLGPWEHGASAIDDRSAAAASGERVFGAAAGLDYSELVLRFLDRYVRGLKNGVDSEPRVKAFVMGDNRWRTADRWPLPGATPMRFSLGRTPDGRGTLASVTPPSGSWSIPSDPLHPIVDPFDGAYGAHDYRALATRADVMSFDSAPFPHDTEVVGRVEVQLTVSADVPDIDVYARLFDVAPDGTAWNLMSPGLEVTRLSERRGATPLRPNEPTTVTVGHHLTGNLFRAGHRLRVVVMPSFFPHFSVNLQTGKRETESNVVRKGTLTLHFGAERPSYVLLPVVGGERRQSR
jgi:putative CocE/NonD family hydrolase